MGGGGTLRAGSLGELFAETAGISVCGTNKLLSADGCRDKISK